MTAKRQRGYHFSDQRHWNRCLVSGAARGGKAEEQSLRAFAPLRIPARPAFATVDAAAPVATRSGEILWRDGAGNVYRWEEGDTAISTLAAPDSLARATRIVAARERLWTARAGARTIAGVDLDSFTLRRSVDLRQARVIDIAADGRDGVFALVERGEAHSPEATAHVLRIDCTGTISEDWPLETACPIGLAYLASEKRIAVLSHGGVQLALFPAHGGARERLVNLAALAPCFRGTHLASDSSGRLFIAGEETPRADNEPMAKRATVLVIDSSLALVDKPGLAEPATGLAVARERLLVTTARGLHVGTPSELVPDETGEVSFVVVTPKLEAPAVADGRRWLRFEAVASLPPGASLEIDVLSAGDDGEHVAWPAPGGDPSLPSSARARLLRDAAREGAAPIVFRGDELPDADRAPFAVPLHDVRARFVWIVASLSATPGGRLPELTRLSVLYPGVTLMEHLPAIYQREEAAPGSFLRSLVGVLESTTQDLDGRIARLGRLIHPDHAPAPWLDYLARWLGLPWDDALTVEQKRCIVSRAREIARARGTRAGLQKLLECLVPGTPPRFRIRDAFVDFGFACVGGNDGGGSTLPAMLPPDRRPSAQLGTKSVLGQMHLPCPDRRSAPASAGMSRVRVEIAASAEERAALEPWLAGVLGEMIPLGARLELRWTGPRGLADTGSLVLDGPPLARLGTDAVTGWSRLPDRDAPMSDTGPTAGMRLH